MVPYLCDGPMKHGCKMGRVLDSIMLNKLPRQEEQIIKVSQEVRIRNHENEAVRYFIILKNRRILSTHRTEINDIVYI